MGTKRGQALMELAVGMFAVAMVTSALCAFAVYIARSLKMQNSLRTGAGSQSDTVELTSFAAEHVFGAKGLTIREKVKMPSTVILK